MEDEKGPALGLLLLSLIHPEEIGRGFHVSHDFIEDHDQEACRPMFDTVAQWQKKLMTGQRYFIIELFGVDHECKGRGVGQDLLQRACDIADHAGLPVFVQSNGTAKGYYAKHGFVSEAEEVMPGEANYVEVMMVRPAKKVK